MDVLHAKTFDVSGKSPALSSIAQLKTVHGPPNGFWRDCRPKIPTIEFYPRTVTFRRTRIRARGLNNVRVTDTLR
jgi:hypothetical protein